jgi:hypothetical protein
MEQSTIALIQRDFSMNHRNQTEFAVFVAMTGTTWMPTKLSTQKENKKEKANGDRNKGWK